MKSLVRTITEPLLTLWDLVRGASDASPVPARPARPGREHAGKSGPALALGALTDKVRAREDGEDASPARDSNAGPALALGALTDKARAREREQEAGTTREKRPSASVARQRTAARDAVSARAPRAPRASAAERYEAMCRELLREHKIRVRKWRTNSSGVAWEVQYENGTIVRLIESPRPRGPMSAAVFLHEVGHHAIGFNRYKPRCLEEYHAWMWALGEMERRGMNITQAVRTRVFKSLRYAVAKAQRRGIKQIPDELTQYIPAPRV